MFNSLWSLYVKERSMNLSPKERVTAALYFDEVDRVPSFIFDGSSWVIGEDNMSYADQYQLEDIGASNIVRHFAETRSDLVTSASSGIGGWATAFGAETINNKVGRTTTTIPCITSAEDPVFDLTYDEIRARLEDNEIVKKMIRQNKEVRRIVGDEYPILTAITAPVTALTVLGGAKFVVKLIGKSNPLLPHCLDFTAAVTAALTDIYTESGADIIAVCDPVGSGDMMSQAAYEAYYMPALQKFLSLKQTNPYLFMHICGHAGDRNECVQSLGFNAFSVDSMVDMEDQLKRANHKMCMMGSLSPTDQMMNGTPESVYAESRRLIDLSYANGGGLLLSTGCDFPSGSPAANAAAMAKACEDAAAERQ